MVVGLGALGGGLLALVTEGFKWFKGHREKKMDFEHEITLLKMQSAVAKEETERETYIAAVDAQTDMLQGARRHDSSIKDVARWVNNVRAMVRPALTFYTVIVATYFYLSGNDAIRLEIVASFMLMMEAIIAFWFTGRVITKGGKS